MWHPIRTGCHKPICLAQESRWLRCASGVASIPEPCALTLIVLGSLALLKRWRPSYCKRSEKCILLLGWDFGILTFVIVILLETEADNYERRTKNTYQAGLVASV